MTVGELTDRTRSTLSPLDRHRLLRAIRELEAARGKGAVAKGQHEQAALAFLRSIASSADSVPTQTKTEPRRGLSARLRALIAGTTG